MLSLFQEVTEKIVKENKPLLNESQELVLAQLPETLYAHTPRDMQVICTRARRKVTHFFFLKKMEPQGNLGEEREPGKFL